MKCCVCNREWANCKVIQLTEGEKQHLRQKGQAYEDQYAYCTACWKVLSDKLMGAQFIKGNFQVQLKARGVQEAEELSQTLFDGLLNLKPKQ